MDKQYQSESINELASALAKAQGEMAHAKKAEDNLYFKAKYADLPAVLDASRPALAKNGLSVIQPTYIDEQGKIVLMTQLTHSSGQWVRSWYPINPVKADSQGIGSAITYARRYAYCSLTGVAATGEDDDGNAASGNHAPVYASPEKAAKSVFSNAALRKTFCDNVIKSFEDAQTTGDLETLFALNSEKIEAMKASGNDHDALAVDELRNRYAVAMKRFKQPAVDEREGDEFSDGGRIGLNY